MIEVHNNPHEALCDGQQSLTPEAFARLATGVKIIRGEIMKEWNLWTMTIGGAEEIVRVGEDVKKLERRIGSEHKKTKKKAIK